MTHRNNLRQLRCGRSGKLYQTATVGVIKVSNQLAWRCPAQLTLSFYNQHLSANHLEVGVGTGYYLDLCRFSSSTPRLVLLDLNPNSLSMAAQRLQRYNPSILLANSSIPTSTRFSGQAASMRLGHTSGS
jgi:hypothetical protein